MPRGIRLDIPGTLHHVMVRGIEGCRMVDDDKDREAFISRTGELVGYRYIRAYLGADG